jgi:hypothetical protein
VLDLLSLPVLALNAELDPYTPPCAFRPIHDVLARQPHPYSAATVFPYVGHSLRLEHQRWGESEADRYIAEWLVGLPGALDGRRAPRASA